MSFTEKHDVTTKEDWLKLLEDNDLGRTNMNKLIMNYLVTGKWLFPIIYKPNKCISCF